MAEFDIVIVGAGPSAVAAMLALDRSRRVAVVTGAVPSHYPSSLVHPKIRVEAAKMREAAGLAESLCQRGYKGKTLFSTAAIGGLANYWGQQFIRYLRAEPWPQRVFASFEDYEEECRSVEGSFNVQGGTDLSWKHQGHGFRCYTPRLITGTQDIPNAGLMSMQHLYLSLERRLAATRFDSRVQSFAPTGERWRITLADGREIVARRILLAAGVVGNARILFRSFTGLTRARFRDHAPWMLYTIGLGTLIRSAPGPSTGHFNAMTIEQVEADRSTVFASVYDLRNTDLNLLLASAAGFMLPFALGWSAPPGMSLMNPVQMWTSETENSIEIYAGDEPFFVASSPLRDPRKDAMLSGAVEFVSGLNGRVLKISQTSPGHGFHYHALEIGQSEGPLQPVADFLRVHTNGGVTCIDGSTLETIGCRPHSLTAMASARRIAHRVASGI